ncbi:MAG: Crp/Fnr family transcriptional regulator [Vitreoscilla sp.]|jgi:hypothetical protein
MFHTPIEPRTVNSSTFGRYPEFAAKPLQFPVALDLCRDQVPESADCDGLRLAAAARRSTSTQAFLPAFANADWRVFASFCVVRRVQAGYRVMIPGRSDRALRFVVEGALWQESAAGNRDKVLAAGAIVGEDALFSDAAGELDVRALEDSLILELPLARQKELTASCPEIGFALLRAAGAVIAARGRPCAASDDEVAAN